MAIQVASNIFSDPTAVPEIDVGGNILGTLLATNIAPAIKAILSTVGGSAFLVNDNFNGGIGYRVNSLAGLDYGGNSAGFYANDKGSSNFYGFYYADTSSSVGAYGFQSVTNSSGGIGHLAYVQATAIAGGANSTGFWCSITGALNGAGNAIGAEAYINNTGTSPTRGFIADGVAYPNNTPFFLSQNDKATGVAYLYEAIDNVGSSGAISGYFAVDNAASTTFKGFNAVITNSASYAYYAQNNGVNLTNPIGYFSGPTGVNATSTATQLGSFLTQFQGTFWTGAAQAIHQFNIQLRASTSVNLGRFLAVSDDVNGELVTVDGLNKRVGINNIAPAYDLDIAGTRINLASSSAVSNALVIRNTSNGNASEASIACYNDSGNYGALEVFSSTFPNGIANVALFSSTVVGGLYFSTLNVAPIIFHTNSNGSSNERMRIDGSGNVLIGTTDNTAIFSESPILKLGFQTAFANNARVYPSGTSNGVTQGFNSFDFAIVGSGWDGATNQWVSLIQRNVVTNSTTFQLNFVSKVGAGAETILGNLNQAGNATFKGNLSLQVGTGFSGILTHAITASRTWTLPDFAGNVLVSANSNTGASSICLTTTGGTNLVVSTFYFVNGVDTAGSLVEANRQAEITRAVTAKNLRVTLASAPGVGTSWIITVRKNGADTALKVTITGAATAAQDTADSISFSAGDLIDYSVTESGVPGASGNARISMDLIN